MKTSGIFELLLASSMEEYINSNKIILRMCKEKNWEFSYPVKRLKRENKNVKNKTEKNKLQRTPIHI
jgi:spore coat protein CotF